MTFTVGPGPGKLGPGPARSPQNHYLPARARPGPASFRPHPTRPAKYHRSLARPGPWAAGRPGPARPVQDPSRGTCLRRPLGTRRPPRLFEKLESYCIKLTSLITRYSVLINCAKEKNCKISSRKDLHTEI